MKKRFLKNALPIAIAATMGIALPSIAQETSSAIQGIVTDANGQPVNDAKITVVHEPSNSRSKLMAGESGHFSARGLRVGGPYTVTISSDNGNRTIQDVYLTLGDAYRLEVIVGETRVEETLVLGSLQEQNYAVVGPNAEFSLQDLATAPAINRDIKDVIRIDPRVYVDEAYNDSIQCAGANPRFNSLTVDGVRMNDAFGLNTNGYPTQRMPFSYDAIDQVAVELAPFDVQYGGFSACNINAVTKSGDNEFHGSFFYDYTDDSMLGDSLEGDSLDIAAFDEQRYGFTVGGPIIKDKLYFFTAYEMLEGVDSFGRGTADASVATPVEGVSEEQFAEIDRIARDIYGYETGGLPPSSQPIEDEKLLVKVDWNISDSQRAAFTYNYNDGFSIAESDGDSNELEFLNHLYERGTELNAYVLQLFSNWNDNLSTEVKVGYQDVQNRALPLGGIEFGEVQITTLNDHDNDGSDSEATVYLGADDSRHANELSYENLNFKLSANYRLDHQTFLIGYERETFDVFNMFIQEAQGEYRFGSVEEFEAGTPFRITYENAAGTNVSADAAASFEYAINTLYFQDEISLRGGDLTIIAGARYDWYESDDAPKTNSDILTTYNIDSAQNLDGADLFQPRLGFNWNLNDALEIHGGIGLYSGGNPNVWLSNNYSNDGVTQIEVQDRSGNSILEMDFTGEGRPIWDIPQDLYDSVANGQGSSYGVNILDPNFEIPASWKYALGGSYSFPNALTLSADLLYSQYENAAIISDISRVPVGTAFDGRPIYDSIDGRRQDYMLTNADDTHESLSLSLGVSKFWDNGLEVAFGYAYSDAEDINPMTSSTAGSNYSNLATSDPENPGAFTSNYNIPHRFTLKVGYEHAFFGDYNTRITLFGSANEGRPYSYTFNRPYNTDDADYYGDASGSSRHLLYIPTGTDDPNVVYGEDFDVDAFYSWVDSEGLTRGDIMDRNETYSDWWIKFDLKIEQELPGIMEGHKSSLYMVVENLGNLMNDDWGVQYEASFPRSQAAVNMSADEQGRYVYEEFIDPAGTTRVGDASLWQMRIGFRYDF
ncbi:TonB-dependent receptor [Gilvimarinus sp. 1_MG-2023]|uniref:TonB-dependent receptor n=1 Tax=Gilvimarinus sp. 1_MG-2023 TaxID=3062638 RepID=UPI0026E269A0|nr:TonB-dependent receptor [Gilvimarinus sp. 1_MG-2023]MDO6746976.1 TonB-dependent receptor [Gilvimarinus sp. 1_MG-2023]